MPRIETETLAQHRDWRRNQLIEAAASIALESGCLLYTSDAADEMD
jgi:hypothetical protein